MANYQEEIKAAEQVKEAHGQGWAAITPEYVARMRLQNRFKTGLDIAKYTAAIMRRDMAEYDANPANYTQSLGCWHGFIGEKTPSNPEQTLPLPFRLDGCRYAFRVRPAARPIHARKNLCARID